MAFYLLSTPSCLGIAAMQFIGGPQGVQSGSNQLLSGGEQTFAAVGSRWRIAVPFVETKGRRAREQRGLITALAEGEAAVRLPFYDRDRMTLAEAGVTGSSDPQDWSGDVQWDGGVQWGAAYPHVSVAASAALGASVVSLADEHWGHTLRRGDMIGFFPLHFGWYMVRGVQATGTYRIWPPLRKAITTDSYATLTPTAVFRAEPGSFGWARDGFLQAGAVLRLFEVTDAEVRASYTYEDAA